MKRWKKTGLCIRLWVVFCILLPVTALSAMESQGCLIVKMKEPGMEITVTRELTDEIWVQKAGAEGYVEIKDLPDGRYFVEMKGTGSIQMQSFTIEIPNEKGEMVIHAYPKFSEVEIKQEVPPATGDTLPGRCYAWMMILALTMGCVCMGLRKRMTKGE